MKENMYILLNEKLIEKISAYFPSKKYKAQSPLFYEGQIPISGYLVLNGYVQISNKKKFKKILTSGALIGLSELFNKTPSKMSAEVFADSEVCFLDKTTLDEFNQNIDPDLQLIITNALERKS